MNPDTEKPSDEQRKVSGASRQSADLAGRGLRGELERHEPEAHERRARVKRGKAGKRHGQNRADRDQRRADSHRPARADAVRHPPCGHGEQHRQQRVQRHQHADGERRSPHRQRVERHDDAAPAEHRVVRDPEQDQQGERTRRASLANRHLGPSASRGSGARVPRADRHGAQRQASPRCRPAVARITAPTGR